MILPHLANPDNIEVQTYLVEGKEELLFPSSVAERAPYMLRMLDIIWCSLLIFGVCCLSTFEHEADSARQGYQSEINGERQALLDDE